MKPRRILGIGVLAGSLGASLAAADTDSLSDAAASVAAGHFEDALDKLRLQFEAGYPTPGDVYADPRFAPLRDAAGARGPWRELMGEFVLQSALTMVPPEEPGTPMHVRGQVLRSPDGEPVAGALVFLYHTDDSGQYEPGRPSGIGSNPRLFAWLRTDAEGRFEVWTIRPREYPGASPGAAHVHYRVTAAGYRPAGDEFRPYTMPREEAERASALQRGQPTSLVTENDRGFLCEVVIPLTAE